jgi:hypothetical protein
MQRVATGSRQASCPSPPVLPRTGSRKAPYSHVLSPTQELHLALVDLLSPSLEAVRAKARGLAGRSGLCAVAPAQLPCAAA